MDIFVTSKPVLLLLRNPTFSQIIQDRTSHMKCQISLITKNVFPQRFFVQPGGSFRYNITIARSSCDDLRHQEFIFFGVMGAERKIKKRVMIIVTQTWICKNRGFQKMKENDWRMFSMRPFSMTPVRVYLLVLRHFKFQFRRAFSKTFSVSELLSSPIPY